MTGGLRHMVGAAGFSLMAGLVVAAIAAGFDGPGSAAAAAAGVLIALGVMCLGTATVHLVSAVMPAASMLVALLTYTLQVVLLLVVFASLDRVGDFAAQPARTWLAVGVIVVALAWTFAHLVIATRARIPTYDLTRGNTALDPTRRGER